MNEKQVKLKYGDEYITFEEQPDSQLFDPEVDLENTLELEKISTDELLDKTSIDLFGGQNG